MKKYLAVLFAFMLFIVGCTNQNGEQDDTDTGSAETMPQGYYEENSTLEEQTSGAVRQYNLPDSNYQWISMVGDRILLATDSNPVQLRMLNGDDGIPAAELELEAGMLRSCQALFNGFCYYNEQTNQVVFLDPQLQQTFTIDLPAEMSSAPVIAPDGSQIFYSTGKEIYAIDVERKLTRLVKTQNNAALVVLDTHFNGKILICADKESAVEEEKLYISAENGQTLTAQSTILSMYSYEDSYLVLRMDGTVLQRITGNRSGDAQQLTIADSNVAGALELGGAVGYDVSENGLLLNYYDLASGRKTASVTLPAITEPQAILADKWAGCIWILADAPEEAGKILLRWDLKKSAVQEDAACIGTLYTAANPNTQELEAIEKRISSLNKSHAVRIRIWKQAVKSPAGHDLVPEHQIAAITQVLDALEPVLKEFPKSFLSKSTSNKLRICIVRSADGAADSIQYWDDDYAFLTLTAGTDIRSEFLKSFGLVVDSHVLGNSPRYDYWETLNPENFAYGGAVNESYTTGSDRAFVDVDSKISGPIDRSRVFWQAMQQDNAELFSNETMQSKLVMLCKAIRDAWNLKYKEEVYPWEQYLAKSIAYKPK